MKKTLLLVSALAGLAFSSAQAQLVLSAGTYTQDFDGIGSGLPSNWTVRTGANGSALGTLSTLSTAQAGAGDTTGAFKNFTAADGGATDRALGLRQTGSFGDGGASFNFNFSTADLEVTNISLKLQILSSQPRSTVWSLQYGIGSSPTSFVTLDTFSDPNTVGSTTLSFSTADFGSALDDVSSVWFRVVALSASTGSGNRDSFAIDDFSITTVAVPEPSTYALVALGLGGLFVLRRTKKTIKS